MERVVLLSNGDFRDTVGVNCWPKQVETLEAVEAAFTSLGVKTERGNPYKEEKRHGFMTTQAEACRVMSQIDPEAPVVVVLASWVYAHHLASAFKLHKGPILLLGNFDGTWPGLVALLNHSGTYNRLGVKHSKIWTDSFAQDQAFMDRLSRWIKTGEITYPMDHIRNGKDVALPAEAEALGRELASHILKNKRIMGQMDPGCMGMLNAVLSPDKMAEIGMPLELLNQSDLVAEMGLVAEKEAGEAYQWLVKAGATFHFGKKEEADLTERQVLEQMKMYIAAGRITRRYGLAAVGIPYQYGLVRVTSASDLPEGMLNNASRPDIWDPESGEIVNQGKPIVHFNEGDLGSGIPQVLMHDILSRKGMPPETTLHDVRWGDVWENRFVWVFLISGGAPPAHFGGWRNTHVYRQPPMYFPLGGGTCSGVSKTGTVTWARFYESFGEIGMDMGTGEVMELPDQEVKRRLKLTNEEWPVANTHIPGYGRDELMSSHRSNHITICYGDILPELISVTRNLGIDVNICGDAAKAFS
jgi:hypothetical protein